MTRTYYSRDPKTRAYQRSWLLCERPDYLFERVGFVRGLIRQREHTIRTLLFERRIWKMAWHFADALEHIDEHRDL